MSESRWALRWATKNIPGRFLFLGLIFLASSELWSQEALIKPGDQTVLKGKLKDIYEQCKGAIPNLTEEQKGGKDDRALLRECLVTGAAANGESLSPEFLTSEGFDLDNIGLRQTADLNSCENKEGDKVECQKKTVKDQNLYQMDQKILDTPELKKLSEYLGKQLEEALYGPEERDPQTNKPKKQKRVVDQEVFVDLYQSRVGKTIISTLTQYCFDANEHGIVDKNRVEQNRKTNLACLKVFNSATPMVDPNCPLPAPPPSPSPDSTGSGDTGQTPASSDGPQNMAAIRFQVCISNVKYICAQGKYALVPGNESTLTEISSSDKKDSRNRACLVVNQLKKLRTTLTRLDTTKERFKKMKEDSANFDGYAFGEGQAFRDLYTGGGENQKSIDDVTSITSADINQAKVQEALEQQKQKVEEACEDPTNPDCAKLTGGVKKEDAEKALDEFDVKTAIGVARIKKVKDEEELKDVLVDTGLTKDEAEKQALELFNKERQARPEANNETILTNVKKQLEEQFARERDALVAELRERIDKKIIKEDATAQEQTAIATTIKNEYANPEKKAEEYKQLIHFNNVVQAYLEIKDPTTGESSRNTGSLFRELKAHGFAQGAQRTPSGAPGSSPTEAPSSYGAQDIEQLEAGLQAEGITEEGGQGPSGTMLNKEQLSQIVDNVAIPTPTPAESAGNSSTASPDSSESSSPAPRR